MLVLNVPAAGLDVPATDLEDEASMLVSDAPAAGLEDDTPVASLEGWLVEGTLKIQPSREPRTG